MPATTSPAMKARISAEREREAARVLACLRARAAWSCTRRIMPSGSSPRSRAPCPIPPRSLELARPRAGPACPRTKKLSGSAASLYPRSRSRRAIPLRRGADEQHRLVRARVEDCDARPPGTVRQRARSSRGRRSRPRRRPALIDRPLARALAGEPVDVRRRSDDEQVRRRSSDGSGLVDRDELDLLPRTRARPRSPPRSAACCRTTTRRPRAISSHTSGSRFPRTVARVETSPHRCVRGSACSNTAPNLEFRHGSTSRPRSARSHRRGAGLREGDLHARVPRRSRLDHRPRNVARGPPRLRLGDAAQALGARPRRARALPRRPPHRARARASRSR